VSTESRREKPKNGLFLDPIQFQAFCNEYLTPNTIARLAEFMNKNCPPITVKMINNENKNPPAPPAGAGGGVFFNGGSIV